MGERGEGTPFGFEGQCGGRRGSGGKIKKRRKKGEERQRMETDKKETGRMWKFKEKQSVWFYIQTRCFSSVPCFHQHQHLEQDIAANDQLF